MPDLISSHYTLAGAAPPAPAAVPFDLRVAAAAEAGFSGIGLVGWDYRALRARGRTDADLHGVLARHGLRLAEVELLSGWLPAVRSCDELEKIRSRQAALYAMVMAFEPHHLIVGDSTVTNAALDVARAAEAFAAICDRVAPHGTRVGIEFIPGTVIPDAPTAWRIVGAAGRANGGLLVDVYHHLANEPGGAVSLLHIPPEHIVGAQLSDHRPNPPGTSHFDGWRYGGLPPGEGDFPLVAFVGELIGHGVDIPWSVEVLSPTLASAQPHAAALCLAEATRGLLARAGTR